MNSEQDELGDDQALLILYLAGELSEEQHAVLERRLQQEPALRRELEGLRSAQAMIWREMLAADSVHPPRGAASSAQRKLAGMVRQWAVDRLARDPVAAPPQRSVKRWALAAAASVAIALGSSAYFYYPVDRGEQDTAIVDAIEDEPVQENAPVDSAPVVTAADNRDEMLVNVALSDLEQELTTLEHLRMLTQ